MVPIQNTEDSPPIDLKIFADWYVMRGTRRVAFQLEHQCTFEIRDCGHMRVVRCTNIKLHRINAIHAWVLGHIYPLNVVRRKLTCVELFIATFQSIR